jgi:hypothetical protein
MFRKPSGGLQSSATATESIDNGSCNERTKLAVGSPFIKDDAGFTGECA